MEKKRFVAVGLLVVVVLSSCSTTPATEEKDILIKTIQGLRDKSKEVQTVIWDLIGSSFDKQCEKAIDDLKKNPNSLDKQLEVCNILMAWANKLSDSFEEIKKAGLPAQRDRVVEGLQTISEFKATEAERFQNRANELNGHWKTRYEQLSTACLNFSKAYALRAEYYGNIPIAEQIAEFQNCIEYLARAKEVIGKLREREDIKTGEETLQQLLIIYEGINSIQKLILTFSEVLVQGVIEAGEDIIEPGMSEKPKKQPKEKSEKQRKNLISEKPAVAKLPKKTQPQLFLMWRLELSERMV